MNLSEALKIKEDLEAQLAMANQQIAMASTRPEAEIDAELEHHQKNIALHESEIAKLTKEKLLGKYYKNELKTVTIPEAAMLTNMGEMTLRAYANPKRENPIITNKDGSRTLVTVESIKRFIK